MLDFFILKISLYFYYYNARAGKFFVILPQSY